MIQTHQQYKSLNKNVNFAVDPIFVDVPGACDLFERVHLPPDAEQHSVQVLPADETLRLQLPVRRRRNKKGARIQLLQKNIQEVPGPADLCRSLLADPRTEVFFLFAPQVQ
jgi:hypothetical protein